MKLMPRNRNHRVSNLILINDKRITRCEDCNVRFLNIFTVTFRNSNDGYPALTFSYMRGGFSRGSACQYEIKDIIERKIIQVVSIQYRLGSFDNQTANKYLHYYLC
ncbi:uncharacterized protein LOC117234541 [Bombus vosnesenskii]|uniref:Uncharacterized protein LOC117234541 n=1 Tax=Bombus vosnesenskii TaxID=207650 RepID=A0A6J3KHF8_9HYME|nr:uncharacterized protein LOC117234541 [Bombus vosnesenskii]